jgi:hypothetical protein
MRFTAASKAGSSLGEGLGMANPWDVLPIEPQGDSDASSIYHAVGLALSQWEGVEGALAQLYMNIINSKSRAAVVAYGTIASGSGRVGMIMAAAEIESSTIDNIFLSDLKTLLDTHIGKLSGRRNEIAHGQVAEFTGGGIRQGHYLVPPLYNTRKQRSPRTAVQIAEFPFNRFMYAYTATQIDQYADHFWNYIEKIDEMSDRLTQTRERFAASRRRSP